MTFTTTPEDRYFEDYKAGEVHEFGLVIIDEAEMIDFARRYDPQPLHTGRVSGEGPVAGGWYIASLTMRLLVDHYISRVAGLGSPGVDELRWLKPVHPGDALSLRVTLLEAERLRSKPDRGYIRAFTEVLNQHREVVMTMKSVGFFLCRDSSANTEHAESDQAEG